MKRIALISLTIIGTLLAFGLLWAFRAALALFGGSLTLAVTLRPLVQRMERRGISRSATIIICYLVILLSMALGFVIYGVGMGEEISTSITQLPRTYDTLIQSWQHGTPLQQAITRGLPDMATMIQQSDISSALSLISGVVSGAIGDVVLLIAMLSLAYYWLTDAAHFERLLLSLLPVTARVTAREIWRTTEMAVGTYIRATVRTVVLAAVLLLALYSSAGLPFAVTLAVLGALSHLIPRLGPALALIPAVLAATTISPAAAGLILLLSALIQIMTHHVAEQSMRDEAFKVNPLLQVLLLLALIEFGGLIAMIFAPPLAALIQVLYSNLVAGQAERPGNSSAISRLCSRLERLQTQADPQSLELISTLRRSDELLKQARTLLDDHH